MELHVDLTPEDAIREMKAIKVQSKNCIAWAQAQKSYRLTFGATSIETLDSDRESYIAEHVRRISALHMAIEALQSKKAPLGQ